MLVVVVQGKEMISIDNDDQREQGGGASHIGSDPFGSLPSQSNVSRWALLPTGVA